jgi:hypothetical protein
MPGGEQRLFDGQLNDDYCIEVLVYLKSQKNTIPHHRLIRQNQKNHLSWSFRAKFDVFPVEPLLNHSKS